VASPVNLYVTLCVWFVIGLITAYLARRRGRSPLPWFAVGLVLGVLGIALLYLWPSPQPAAQKEALAEGVHKELTPAPTESLTPASISHETASVLWHYLDGEDEQQGPVSLPELERLWRNREVNLESYVWSQGMPDWQLIDALPTLKGQLQSD